MTMSKPKSKTSKAGKVSPNWPSKNPGKPSGKGRDYNPPKKSK